MPLVDINLDVQALAESLIQAHAMPEKAAADAVHVAAAAVGGVYHTLGHNEPLMLERELFLDAQHSISGRFAAFEDDGTSAWLYLTEPSNRKPVADAWVNNRIPAPPTKEIQSFRGGPPPTALGYASVRALCQTPQDHAWSFVWSTDGNSAAIAKDGIPVACIVAAQKPGYSRELTKDGPWGNTWSDVLFESSFP